MAKIHDRKEFLELIKQAANEVGARYEAVSGKCHGHATTWITLTLKDEVRRYPLGQHYDLATTSSYDEVLKKLFGRNKREWPACLPGSKSQATLQPS